MISPVNVKLSKCCLKKVKTLCRHLHHNADVRVRFAPSPTGYLHIGGLRTALFNFLFARIHKNGKFILRIEDTDQSRVVPDSVSNLISTLEWVGIVPDESCVHGGGHGPYTQSKRLHHYKKYSDELVESGAAYHCFCSEQRLALLKKDQLRRKEHPRYDNKCRTLSPNKVLQHLNAGVPNVTRLKLMEGNFQIYDSLCGNIRQDISNIEGDPVILKSDGYPTYHLANVVDDHLMEITHIIRGKEWLQSTIKHKMIYNKLGWNPPQYMHLPLYVNPDRSKLSKRQSDVFVELYRQQGYTPATILNFIADHSSGFPQISKDFPVGTNNEEETMEMLIKSFNPKKITPVDACLNFSKLDEFSRILTERQISTSSTKLLDSMIKNIHERIELKYGIDCLLHSNHCEVTKAHRYIREILHARKGHIKKVVDIIDDYDYLWVRPKFKPLPEFQLFVNILEHTERYLHGINWEGDLPSVLESLRSFSTEHNHKFGNFIKFLRLALTGHKEGSAFLEVIRMLGKKETLYRLNSVKQIIKNRTIQGDALT